MQVQIRWVGCWIYNFQNSVTWAKSCLSGFEVLMPCLPWVVTVAYTGSVLVFVCLVWKVRKGGLIAETFIHALSYRHVKSGDWMVVGEICLKENWRLCANSNTVESNPTATSWHKIMTEIWMFFSRTCVWHKRCREREHRILAEGADNCKVSSYTLYRIFIVCFKMLVELFSKYYCCVVLACLLNYFLNNITVLACVLNYFVKCNHWVSMRAELFCK